MSYTLQNVIDQVGPVIRDTTGGTVEDSTILASANRCNNLLKNKYGIYASKNRSVLNVFPSVYEYPVPTDFHDLITVYDRGIPINVTKKNPSEFWLRLNQEDRMVAIDAITGDRFLLAKIQSAGSSAVIHDCDSVTANGTWAADAVTSDATNVVAEAATKKVGSGSISFDVDVSQSGNNYSAVALTGATAVDLSDMDGKGTAFLWLYIPDATYVSSATLRWGSSATDYSEKTVTAQFNGQSFRSGWNRLGFAWASATDTGTPVTTAIDYAYFRLTYSASQTDMAGVLIDDLRMETPTAYELSYYSSRMVRSNGGALQDTFAANDDETLLADEDADILYFYCLSDALWIKERVPEMKEAQLRFAELVSHMKARYASERKRESKRYY